MKLVPTQNPQINDGIYIYPNPTSSIVKFETDLSQRLISLSILDISGNMLHQENQFPTALDLSFVIPGIYIVEFIFEDFRLVKRIVKF